jgi:hypothetical protein
MNVKKKVAWMAGLLVATLAITAVPGYSDTLLFQDDDVEAVIRCTNPATATGCQILQTGTITTGDIFLSVFEMPTYTINGANAIPAGSELTGIVALQVTSTTAGDGNDFAFGAYSGINPLLDFFGSTAPDLPAGAAVAMFINSTSGAGGDLNLNLDWASNPATNCTSVAQCVQQATLGSVLQIDGFRGDPDEFWLASNIFAGSADISAVHGQPGDFTIAVFNFGISNFFHAGQTIAFKPSPIVFPTPNCSGVSTYAADGCVQFTGTGNVLGGAGLTNGFIAHSDFDASKLTAIPEPTTVSLLGLGLLALGAIRMRRNKA